MKFNIKTLLLILAFGLCVVILETWAYLVFSNRGDVLFGYMIAYDIYIRVLIILLFIIFSLLLSYQMAKRTEAVKILRKSEKKFGALFYNINIGVAIHEVITDETGKPVDFIFLDANPKFEEQTELKLSEIKGKRGSEILLENKLYLIEKFGEVGLTGEPLEIGDYSDHLGKYWQIKVFSPQPGQFALALFEITQQVRMANELSDSQKKMKSLFESMREMVAVHDIVFDEEGNPIDYVITDCNETFSKILGIKKEDAIGNLATDVYDSDLPPFFERYTKVALEGGEDNFEIYYEPNDVYLNVSVVSPKTATFATVSTDITEYKRIQNVISAKNKELENYLYIASHDLRSPLINIQGFSMRIKKIITKIEKQLKDKIIDADTETKIIQTLQKEIPETLEYIFLGTEKMDALIRGLLQLSRTGNVKMEFQKIDINNLVNNIVSTMNFLVKEVGAEIIIQPLHDCFGDKNLLNRLFSNLLENAVKYRRPDVKLKIEVSSQKERGRIIYQIKDNGIGIAQKNLEKIWNIFFRVNSQSNSSGEGIGLSLVKKIADRHGGAVRIESQVNIGTTFFIELPDKPTKKTT